MSGIGQRNSRQIRYLSPEIAVAETPDEALSRYSHARMQANRRALDGIAAARR